MLAPCILVRSLLPSPFNLENIRPLCNKLGAYLSIHWMFPPDSSGLIFSSIHTPPSKHRSDKSAGPDRCLSMWGPDRNIPNECSTPHKSFIAVFLDFLFSKQKSISRHISWVLTTRHCISCLGYMVVRCLPRT